MFTVYLQLGIDHILDINGYDHILFVVALCALYLLRDWKQVLILATAFTFGHSLTLALSSYNILRFDPNLIEVLIPVTIILTGLYNLFVGTEKSTKSNILHYAMALIFGFIHGMGFSNYFRALVGDESIILQLFAFNVGVEIGQIVIVLSTLLLSFVFVQLFKCKHQYWNYFLSGLAIVVSLYLIFQA